MSEDSPASPESRRPRLRKRLQLPLVSGKWTVFWVTVCLATTGLLIPLVLKKPLWVELELVIAAWWLISGLLLTRFLYLGARIDDDHKPNQPRNWLGSSNTTGSDLSGCSGVDGEGCLILIGLVAVFFVVWLLIELAIPLVFFVMYFLIRGMIVHAVHERHSCQNNLLYSVVRGFLWATVYTAPLAGIVWFIHFLQARA